MINLSIPAKTIEGVIEDYKNGVYSNEETTLSGSILPTTYVFDENLTIAKNKSLVAAHNEKIEAQMKTAREEGLLALRSDCIDALVDTYIISREQANAVLDYVRSEEANRLLVLERLNEVGELAKAFIMADKTRPKNVCPQTVTGVFSNYRNHVYTQLEPSPKGRILPLTHEFNQELTVVQNRKLIEEHNAAVLLAIDNYETQVKYLANLLKRDCKEALVYGYGLSDEQAELINNYAYSKLKSRAEYIHSLLSLGAFAVVLKNTTH